MNIDNCLADTKKYITDIETKFIQPYIPVDPKVGPDIYETDVRSFIILCHSAFEELMENIAIYLYEESYNSFLMNKYNKSVLSILNTTGIKMKIPEENESDIRFFDNVRKVLVEAKDEFSKKVYDNHGVSVKYMRKLFYPVALDIPNDMKMISAINWIAEYRGSYAHRRNGKKPPSPEDCKDYVTDSIQLFETLIIDAKKIVAVA